MMFGRRVAHNCGCQIDLGLSAIAGASCALPEPQVSAEMALHVLAYNLTRVMNIVGKQSLLAAIRAT
jgi:hypothetical protein